MISVFLECQDQDQDLVQTLSVLVAGAVEGLVSEVVVLGKGASDSVRLVSDAAGCRFHEGPADKALLASARGGWLLFVECGARPQPGWIEDLGEYCALFTAPAAFTPARAYRLPFWRRWFTRPKPFEHGLLIRREDAVARIGQAPSVAVLSTAKVRRLGSELIPASVIRAERRSGLRPAAL